MFGYGDYSGNARIATVKFTGIENLDISGSALVNGPDLIIARGQGTYDGKGGTDTIVADLSTASNPDQATPVRLLRH